MRRRRKKNKGTSHGNKDEWQAGREPDGKRQGMRLKRKTRRGWKVCVFPSRRLRFANRKLRLRFLYLKQNRVLHNCSIPAPGPPGSRPLCKFHACLLSHIYSENKTCRQICLWCYQWRVINKLWGLFFFLSSHFTKRFKICSLKHGSSAPQADLNVNTGRI